MNLRAPDTLLVAWVLAPLLVCVVAGGLGLAVQELSALRLGTLTLPTGFLTGIVVMVAALRLGATGTSVAVVVIVCSLAGYALALRRARAEGLRRLAFDPWAIAAGVAAYLFTLAPLAGSGRAGILGYVFNNDPSVHVVIVEYLKTHGLESVGQPNSSFEAAAAILSTNYPIGGHVWVLLASVVSGVDAFYVWQPVLSVAAVALALAAVGFLRALGVGRAASAVGGFLAANGFLTYSFVVEGGFKEIVVAGALIAFAALFGRSVEQGLSVRRLIPLPLVALGALLTFSMAAAAWFGPAFVVVLVWLVVSTRGRWSNTRFLTAGVAVAVLVALPLVGTAVAYLRDNQSIFERADQVGNLLAPVPFWEAFNVWLAHDYRYPTPLDPSVLTTIGIAVVGALAVVGAVAAIVRRSAAGVMLLISAATGTAAIAAASASIYYELKAYVVVAPALGLATVVGLVWLWERLRPARPLVGLLALAAGLGVLTSAALVYSGAWVTPKDRFARLADAGRHVPRGGPVLVNDREYYAKYFLRDKRPWNSWDEWQPYRGFRWGEIPPPPPRNPDLDDYKSELLQTFPTLLDRRRPGGSRPPGNYRLAYENANYSVWRRVGPPPRMHVSLGIDSLQGSGRLDCSDSTVRSLLTAARRGGTVRYAPPAPQVTTGDTFKWGAAEVLGFGPAKHFTKVRGGAGIAYLPVQPGRYRVWAQGAYGPGIRVYLGSKTLGEVRSDEEQIDGWHPVASVQVQRAKPTFALRGLNRPWWLAGSTWNNLSGPLAVEPDVARRPPVEIPGREARRLCNRELDWVELV
jgi:hypothetical protein